MSGVRAFLLVWVGCAVLALLSNLAPDGALVRDYATARIFTLYLPWSGYAWISYMEKEA